MSEYARFVTLDGADVFWNRCRHGHEAAQVPGAGEQDGGQDSQDRDAQERCQLRFLKSLVTSLLCYDFM